MSGDARPKTIDELLQDKSLSDEERAKLEAERLLGAVALLVQRRGRDDLAADLLLVQELRIEWNNDDWNDRDAIAVLVVETENISRFTDQLLTDVLSALQTVDPMSDRLIAEIRLAEQVPPVPLDWRAAVKQAAVGAKVSNQGRTVRHNVARFEEDGLQFSNALELRFYKFLKESQESLPSTETFSIFPLPAQRALGKNFEPDFVIAYEGRCAIIELDGGNHSRRIAADQSRDRLIKNAGFKMVERLAVEEVHSIDEVRAFIDSVLKRLSKS